MASLLGSVLSSVGKSAPQISKNYYDTKIAMWREQNLMDRERYQQDQLNLRHAKEMDWREKQLVEQRVNNLYTRHGTLSDNLKVALNDLDQRRLTMKEAEYNAEFNDLISEYGTLFGHVEQQLSDLGHTIKPFADPEARTVTDEPDMPDGTGNESPEPPNAEPNPPVKTINETDENKTTTVGTEQPGLLQPAGNSSFRRGARGKATGNETTWSEIGQGIKDWWSSATEGQANFRKHKGRGSLLQPADATTEQPKTESEPPTVEPPKTIPEPVPPSAKEDKHNTTGRAVNNPGNIRNDGKSNWQGMTGNSAVGDYVNFETPEHGVRALAIDLSSKMERGLVTIEDILTVYAPNNENDTESYIKYVARKTGFKRDMPLAPHYIPDLVVAIINYENSATHRKKYTPEVITSGLQMAGMA